MLESTVSTLSSPGQRISISMFPQKRLPAAWAFPVDGAILKEQQNAAVDRREGEQHVVSPAGDEDASYRNKPDEQNNRRPLKLVQLLPRIIGTNDSQGIHFDLTASLVDPSRGSTPVH